MKQSEYTTISVREKIEDKDIAHICDYLERNAKDFEYIKAIGDWIVDGYIFTSGDRMIKIYDRNNQVILYIPTKVLADNIVGIWGTIRNL